MAVDIQSTFSYYTFAHKNDHDHVEGFNLANTVLNFLSIHFYVIMKYNLCISFTDNILRRYHIGMICSKNITPDVMFLLRV